MNVSILFVLDLKIMTLKHVIHTLQKTQQKDAERNNLVPKRKLISFVLQHVKKNVVVNVRILFVLDLMVIALKRVIDSLQKTPTKDAKRINLVLEKK